MHNSVELRGLIVGKNVIIRVRVPHSNNCYARAIHVEDGINAWHELLLTYMYVLNMKTKINRLVGMLFVALINAFSDFGDQTNLSLRSAAGASTGMDNLSVYIALLYSSNCILTMYDQKDVNVCPCVFEYQLQISFNSDDQTMKKL